jgi:hypothetical protein
VNVECSDPREQKRGWISDPVHEYHVELWHAPASGNLWRCAEHRLTEAHDVHEALAWADAASAEQEATYALYAVVDEGETEGLVWIAGINPTSSRGNFTRPHPTAS